ncbi:insulin-like peptide INSL6 [Orycteropus afer afer]|uniref:Insulin-like peptide INSL6 n=1 Tax=Orycteropus afer afer TaxID=1230840 RepID=A0A8B6ZP43_ORYAF|nr:insulin-like peptide INSL6 [Orycteropus afer afer]
MPPLISLCRLRFGLLLVLFSLELGNASRAKKLCGRHLLKEIVKLCGLEDWSLFEEGPSHHQLVPRAVDAMGACFRAGLPRSPVPSPGGGTGPQPVSTAASMEEAINSLKSLPEYQHQKANSPPDKTRQLSLPHINTYIHKIQDKNTNKIKTLSNLFWGNHPQRKRRGYSEKCCLKGCTKGELSIACLPYIDYKKLETDHQL